jgi:hypothetical protein
MTHWYHVCVNVSREGVPVQATVTVYEDHEKTRVTTRAIEPFYSWQEVVNEMIDTLPIQLRLM